MKNKLSRRVGQIVKRIGDLIVGIIALIVLSPAMLILCVLVWIKLGWPVFFAQERPGLNGKIFKMFKFRSMRSAYASDGTLLPDSDRLTPLGKAMRSTSLDELPELINIIKGEMSWVGPRPLLVEYLERYSPEQARRHDVLPGMTGWAQINGRNAISWEDKFKLDVWYVDNWSLWLDLKIMLLTFGKVFNREAISAPGSVTAPIFMGSPKDQEPD